MNSTKLESIFLGFWRRSISHNSPLTSDLLESWCKEKGIIFDSIENKHVGLFSPKDCIVLSANNRKACFPKKSKDSDEQWLTRNRRALENSALWEKVEWFLPFWVPLRKINVLLADIKHQNPKRAIELFKYHTSTLYTLAFKAVCIAQIFPQSNCLKDFTPIAREAYLAFYSGHKAASIAALIPVVEGALRKIGTEKHTTIFEKIDFLVDRAISYATSLHYEHMWVPREYTTLDYLFGDDERIFALQTFRQWLKKSFFCSTHAYVGITWLNRHGFAHATTSSWQDGQNFERIIIALTTIGAIESWHKDTTNPVSLLFPEMSDDSKFLWQQALFRGQLQASINLCEERLYHENGRLVPELPTDNGVALRKALLSKDCINDLVRPLSKSGWSVKVGEPSEDALHINVKASSGTKILTIALLYSCATDNKIYKELERSSDVILYRGAPYHQDHYAYDIKKHVGPVIGWQPPSAI